MAISEPFDTATHLELGLMQGFPPPAGKRVDRFNGVWEPPFNRWAYQNMRRIWPTAPVRPSDDGKALRREIDADIGSLSVRRKDGSLADFETFLRQTFTDSLIVVHKDRVVYERYLNGMTPDTPHIMFSCTKSFIGLFALMAIEEGLVTRDTPIVDIIPELDNGSGFSDATFGQVLHMTASLKFSEFYDDPDAEIHDYVAVLGAGIKAVDWDGPQSLYDYASTLTKLEGRAHGSVFEYQTPQADVLNWAVSRLFGQNFVTLLESRLWSRLGMTGEAYVLLDATGNLFAGGGLNATAEDMARFAAVMLRNGHVGGDQIIPEAVIDTLSQGGSTEAFLMGPSAEEDMANGHWSYCAQWWIRNTPGSEAIIALGVNGQWIYIDRNREVAVIKQSSQPEADSWYFHDYTCNAMDALVRHVAGENVT